MRNSIAWVLSLSLFCGAITLLEADVNKCKEIKEKKPKNHNPGCNCGGKPPKPPKFWFWFNSK